MLGHTKSVANDLCNAQLMVLTNLPLAPPPALVLYRGGHVHARSIRLKGN